MTDRAQFRLLFINPSLRPGAKTKCLPVGLASVMTYVAHHGYHFDLLDIDIHEISDEAVEAHLATHPYDVILAGSIVTHYTWMKWLVRTAKRLQPQAKVVIGNSVGGSIPELFINQSGADFVVIGEGEITCLALLDALREGKEVGEVMGLAWKQGENVLRSPPRPACNINELPMIDWRPFDTEAYFLKSWTGAHGMKFESGRLPRVMPVATARGCVFRCTFCHFVFWDDPYRQRTPENILAEIRRDIELYQVDFINFWDDLSFSSLGQVERMADAILASGLDFKWSASARTDLFGKRAIAYEKRLAVAEKLKRAGCVSLGFSLESGNQDILEMMEKRIHKDEFVEQVELLRHVGINSSVSVVFGYPIETAETIAQTFELCEAARIYPSIGFLLPLPRTKMYEYAKEKGYIRDENHFLDSITERQDICLNMTQLDDGEIMDIISDHALRLSELLELGLQRENLIKTGGYRNHRKETANSDAKDAAGQGLKRTRNDFSFNYSQSMFDELNRNAAAEVDEDV